MGAQKMLSSIDSLLKNAKMAALTKIHLYQLCIDNNDQSIQIETPVNTKLQNNNLALFIIKNIFVKRDNLRKCRRFSTWKFKVVLFEWRMS
jgi:hypothetical protein